MSFRTNALDRYGELEREYRRLWRPSINFMDARTARRTEIREEQRVLRAEILAKINGYLADETPMLLRDEEGV